MSLYPKEHKVLSRIISLSLVAVTVYFLSLTFNSCKLERIEKTPLPDNIIIIVMDGARYSETWGDSTRKNIPMMSGQLAKHGVVYTNFYNNGPTYTSSGHTSITTGNYQELDNSGNENPDMPSIFQSWNYNFNHTQTDTWVIASKDKLAVLAKCKEPTWMNFFCPSINCGINGLGSGNRNDSLTYKTTIEILTEYHPKLVLINFMEPDVSGHSGNWKAYLNGITKTDGYINGIWQFLQIDSIYRNNTTLFVTNDHGRHLDGVANGFVSHGDTCEGCRHISLLVCGPNIKEGEIIDTRRELIDIPTTIASMLKFKIGNVDGQIMNEIFK